MQNLRDGKRFYTFGLAAMASAIFALSVLANPAQESSTGEWPQWRGPNGDGISAETNWKDHFPSSGPDVLWERDIGFGYASVSISGGRLYTAGWKDGQDTIYCLDANSGELIWSHSYSAGLYDSHTKGGPSATPAVSDDRVYSLSAEGELICLDANDADVLWSKSMTREFGAEIPRWGFAGSPVVLGNVLFVDVGPIVAFNKTNGDVIWRTEDYGSAYSTPVPFKLGGRQLLAVFPRLGLVLLDAKTGREMSKYPWKTHANVNAATPIISGKRFFISSGYNTGCAMVELSNGNLDPVWDGREMRNHMATCVLVDGYLYGFDEDRFKCLDFANGEVQWSQRKLGKGALMAADNKLIVLAEHGELIIADASPDAFTVRSRAKVLDENKCWAVPVLAGGKIYCRSGGGQLVCVDVRGDQ